MSKDNSNFFAGRYVFFVVCQYYQLFFFKPRPVSLLVRPSDITAPPVHNMNRFNPYTSAEKVDLGQELLKLREEAASLQPLPIDSEQLRVYVRLRPTDIPDDEVVRF